MFEMTAGSVPGVRKIITLPAATTHSNVRLYLTEHLTGLLLDITLAATSTDGLTAAVGGPVRFWHWVGVRRSHNPLLSG
jgi:hypothetical protein